MFSDSSASTYGARATSASFSAVNSLVFLIASGPYFSPPVRGGWVAPLGMGADVSCE